jgi:CMP-N-acetylneuraminic acid synthetase
VSTPASIAIILARAGSKGVPGKNAAPIAGKPCIAWTIEYALRSRSMVALSTDDPRITDLARTRYPQLELIPRPAHLASGTARIDDAARHAIQTLESKHAELKHPETRIILLYGNVPVRPPGLIERALHTLAAPGTDSVQSYQPVGKNHPWWTARLDPETNEVRPWEGEVLNHGIYRRQDLPPAFIPDGAILAMTRRALFLEVPGVSAGPHAFFGKTRRGIISPGPVIDIDSPLDLAVADAMLRASTVTP